MRAWAVGRPGPLATRPLRPVERQRPTPGAGEVLVRVRVCGVCRTDLHLAEGDLAPRRPDTVPGHEVVGEVAGSGPGAHRFAPGHRIGIAWLRHTPGSGRAPCAACGSGPARRRTPASYASPAAIARTSSPSPPPISTGAARLEVAP
jgi:propanol-preferring alcohol dehydrogenase